MAGQVILRFLPYCVDEETAPRFIALYFVPERFLDQNYTVDSDLKFLGCVFDQLNLREERVDHLAGFKQLALLLLLG